MKLLQVLDFPSRQCCPDLGKSVQQADFESLVTCVAGSISVDMSCGFMMRAGMAGGAGRGGPADKLGCFHVNL